MITTTTTTYQGTISATQVRAKRASSYISIAAFDALDLRILETTLDKRSWLCSFHPLLDCPSERKELGVRTIVADHYGSLGRLEARWTIHYSADGAVNEAFERREEPVVLQSELWTVLQERLRWVTPIHGI